VEGVWLGDQRNRRHDLPAIRSALSAAPFEAGRPTAIVAHTVKGKGVGFMENNLEWHYRPPREDDLRLALAEIEETIPEACLQV